MFLGGTSLDRAVAAMWTSCGRRRRGDHLEAPVVAGFGTDWIGVRDREDPVGRVADRRASPGVQRPDVAGSTLSTCWQQGEVGRPRRAQMSRS